MDLPSCIHIGYRPLPELFEDISNSTYLFGDRDKPYGGLWTSVLNVEHGTDWLRYCEHNHVADSWHGTHTDHAAWQVHINPDARILHIDSEETYKFVCELYPIRTGGKHTDLQGVVTDILHVDWQAVAREYDVIWMGEDAWKYVRTWDCETILITNWSAVQGVEQHEWATRRKDHTCKRERLLREAMYA